MTLRGFHGTPLGTNESESIPWSFNSHIERNKQIHVDHAQSLFLDLLFVFPFFLLFFIGVFLVVVVRHQIFKL